jgi:glycosyltransferase involved in cell wall biosynthesis
VTTATPKSICFVTNELFPIQAGGIGRLMYNFAVHNANLGSGVRIWLLLPSTFPADALPQVEAIYAELAVVHRALPLVGRSEQLAQLVARLPQESWAFDRAYRASLEYYLALLDAEQRHGGPFDIIEFPDYGGWAGASVAAKRAGLAFHKTIIAARLHSSLGLIAHHERFYHHPSSWLGYVCDLERNLLERADLVVGHVPGIAARNAEFYRFGPEWRGRVHIEFPLLTRDELDDEDIRLNPSADGDPSFIFSSRLQPFKRPDLFINAAIGFLEATPEYTGAFRLVSYGWDQDYIKYLKDLIPPTWTNQIIIIDKVAAEERQRFLRQSIVVVPSDYESLCLFAFEASILGQKVILNRRCEAFGSFERWIDGDNCLFFDGSAEDLTRVMRAALTWTPRSIVDTRADPPYWTVRRRRDEHPAPRPLPKTSLVCYGFSSVAELNRTALLLRLLRLSDVEVHIFLANAIFGGDTSAARFLEANGWTPHFLAGYGQQPEQFGRRLARLDQEILVLLPYGFQLHPQFLAHARQAMAQSPNLALCSSHVRVIDPEARRAHGLRLYAGDLPSTAMLENLVAPPVAAIRRSVLIEHPFDDRARSYWFEAWTRQLALRGHEIVIMPSAEIDALHSGDGIANSHRLTGTIIDDVGIAAGLPARLIAAEPKGVDNTASRVQRHDIANSQLQSAIQIWPTSRDIRNFALVFYRGDLDGLLVHPIGGTPVIAQIAAPNGAIRRVDAAVINAHDGNRGIEFALAVASRAVTREGLEALARGAALPGWALSPWTRLEPQHRGSVALVCMEESSTANSLLLLSRIPKNGSESCCHAVFKDLRLMMAPLGL